MKTTIFNSFVILITLLTIQQTNSQWQQTGMNTGNVSSIAGNSNKIFAGAGDLFYSTDDGSNWINAGINNYSFLVGCYGNNIFAVPTAQSPYIFVSHDNGLTWNTPYLDASGFLSMAVYGSNFYSGAIFDGLSYSTNNGANWSGFQGISGSIYRIAASENNIFYSEENLGNIYHTTNNGNNWSQTTLSAQRVYSITVNGINIYAGIRYNGLYISTDNGASWNQSSLNSRTALSIVAYGNNVFAGTDSSGVFYSNNNGTTWNQINEGLGNLNVGALFINNNYIFAGTAGNGIWKRPLSDVLAVHNISSEVPKEYSLFQNYPNPFNPTTNIEFRIADFGLVTIKIYDVQGKEIAVIVNEQLKPGIYKADFDGSKFASGVYFYMMVVAGEFGETKRMILVK